MRSEHEPEYCPHGIYDRKTRGECSGNTPNPHLPGKGCGVQGTRLPTHPSRFTRDFWASEGCPGRSKAPGASGTVQASQVGRTRARSRSRQRMQARRTLLSGGAPGQFPVDRDHLQSAHGWLLLSDGICSARQGRAVSLGHREQATQAALWKRRDAGCRARGCQRPAPPWPPTRPAPARPRPRPRPPHLHLRRPFPWKLPSAVAPSRRAVTLTTPPWS